MSELRLPAEDEESAGSFGDGKNQQQIRYETFFRLWPIAFIKHVHKQASRHDTEKEQRDYYAISIWRGLSFLIKLAIIEIAIIAPLSLIYLAGTKHAAEWVIAIFTIVMAITTGLQWYAMREELKRSDAVIAAMRIEQKAWLSIESIFLNELAFVGSHPCCIKISNTGQTPGKITKRTVRAYARETGKNYDSITKDFEAIGFDTDFEYLVIPGAPVHIGVDLDKVDVEDAGKIVAGTMEYHILCRFQYMDISRGLSEIKGFYTWNRKTKYVSTHPNYCSFP